MADMANCTANYSHSYGCDNPWFVGSQIADSLRREHAFISEQMRDQLTDILSTEERNSGALTVAIEKTGAANALAIEKTAAANALATQNVAATLTLQASQNHATLLAQLKDCCCEIQRVVIEDGQKTRDRIDSIEADRLRTDNAALTARLLALETRGHQGGGS
jgi:hypothetical protein